jgi:DNA-binding GntR family transcriptional regulator
MPRGSREGLLSHRLRDEVLSWIDRARLRPGAQLPSEPELANELGVSRPTLRETLRSLEEEGMLTRTRGAGTFLTDRPRVRNNLDANFGVTDAIRASGMRPGIARSSTTRRVSTGEERERLQLDAGREVVVLERVRTADGRPVVHSTDVLPADLLGGRRDALARLSRGSVYGVLERDLGVAIHHGVATFAPERAGASLASVLGVKRGALLLYLTQVDYDDAGRPVLASDEHHVADAFEFTVIRRGPGRRLD